MSVRSIDVILSESREAWLGERDVEPVLRGDDVRFTTVKEPVPAKQQIDKQVTGWTSIL